MRSLLLGAGNSRKKKIIHPLTPDEEFTELTTLDIDWDSDPDIVHDLNNFPYPFEDGSFDEIHAYEVLEHCGYQGDYEFFFEQFNEFHRILSEGGVFCGTVPCVDSIWAFGDPGHTRVLPPTVFNFLQESFYDQLGETSCTDYRSYIKGWWKGVLAREEGGGLFFILRKV